MAANGDQETAVHGVPEVTGPPVPPGPLGGPALEDPPADALPGGDGGFEERPEVYAGAAFAGGLALALLMRWIRS
ncbi:MAG TPA: hypothetical protein VNT32_12235 [Thermoleophilaceae bacterium]|nr:hypothetical protein [Thermoleophilaceae bacterium]